MRTTEEVKKSFDDLRAELIPIIASELPHSEAEKARRIALIAIDILEGFIISVNDIAFFQMEQIDRARNS